MTPKEQRDAIIELRDMAYEHERRAAQMDGTTHECGKRRDRAAMLRAVASFIERHPEAA